MALALALGWTLNAWLSLQKEEVLGRPSTEGFLGDISFALAGLALAAEGVDFTFVLFWPRRLLFDDRISVHYP